MPSIQPTLPNTNGVILTVGCVCNGDRQAIVLPLVVDQVTPDKDIMCPDAIVSFQTLVQSDFLSCCSTELYIAFVSAEGMKDGVVPSRVDYVVGAYSGTFTGSAMPSNVTGLITFYEDPLDVTPPSRMRTGKNFIPGVPSTAILGDEVQATLVSLYHTLGNVLLNGFASTTWSAQKWWRCLSVPKPRSGTFPCKRIVAVAARGKVYTQRRRLTPR